MANPTNDSVWLEFVKGNYPSLFPLLPYPDTPLLPASSILPHYSKGRSPALILKENYALFVQEIGIGIPHWVRPLLWLILLDAHQGDDQTIYSLGENSEDYECMRLVEEILQKEDDVNLDHLERDTPRIMQEGGRRSEEMRDVMLAFCQLSGTDYSGGKGFILKNLMEGLFPLSSPSPSPSSSSSSSSSSPPSPLPQQLSDPVTKEILLFSFAKVMNGYNFQNLFPLGPSFNPYQEAITPLLPAFLPHLSSHFSSLDLLPFGWEFKFLLSGFGYFPPPIIIQIWDRFLLFGVSELFTAILAFLGSWEEEFLAAKTLDECFPFFHRNDVKNISQFLRQMELLSPNVSHFLHEKYPDFFEKNYELGAGTKSAKK